MFQPIYRLFIELTNGKWTSEFLRKFARSPRSRKVVSRFAKAYKLNTEEMEKPLAEFPTLHDLFIRKLKPGSRPVDQGEFSVVSPVDAVIEDIGTIKPNSEMEVKGKIYSVADMLGDMATAEKYMDGIYMIFYLSPSHYHRIHSPVDGQVKRQWALGAKSYPVNKWGLKYGVDTLSKNYRMISEIETASGMVAVVKVGAMFVNSIETTHSGTELKKGGEMAYFSFGSTIVLLFEKGCFTPDQSLVPPFDIRMGEKVGSLRTGS
ncbi:phosphatidylserine decarboxylase [Neobacillus piezotolerans]|uniref:Phosphatidylserine decarboxylase proenzyme n=1 Tax=Neobacillus piezotolerans TaxID=2259171 RepID=A0A3D8GLV9_9BACI|nr:phosphatidylserine decarboxylase [Neobacillus piezotolerans]RDU35460.1 phosphatidylserine decarboxylase [Neobacillus piezotolerans]